MQKELFLVLDTETIRIDKKNIAYDIGYIISNRKGDIIKKSSFLIKDIFLLGNTVNPYLIDNIFYKDKIIDYIEGLQVNDFTLVSIQSFANLFYNDIKQFNIDKIYAYNCTFDFKSINNLLNLFNIDGTPFNQLKFYCIWNIASHSLLNSNNYFKYAIDNNLYNENTLNVLTKAESTYKYITKQPYFVESHTGLKDCEIELEILLECFKRKKKLHKELSSTCWNIPQKRFKEYYIKYNKGA